MAVSHIVLACCRCCFFFFFSSRRRHTRLQGDWSSDVCSSDLQATSLELYAWSSDQAQDYLDRKWASMYEGVVRANATIRLLQLVSQTKPGEISRADSMSIMGEALFLRAHYHFELWRMWGNVPYYFAADTDFRKP